MAKMKVQLKCTRGDDKPGAIVSVSEKEAKGLIGQNMAVEASASKAVVDSGSGDEQLQKDLSAEKTKVKQLEKDLAAEKTKVETSEKAIKVHEDTIKTLEGRIETGGKGFDLLVGSIRELDPKAEDIAAKVEELQESLGDPEGGKAPTKKGKKK